MEQLTLIFVSNVTMMLMTRSLDLGVTGGIGSDGESSKLKRTAP